MACAPRIWHILRRVEVYTDGACSGNPGPGGWGAILRYGDHGQGAKRWRIQHHQQPHGVDWRQLTALNALTRPCEVDLYTDSSSTSRTGFPAGSKAGRRNGWKTAAKKPVKNAELWQALEQAREQRTRSPGTGSRAMPATPKTSAPMNWRGPGWRPTKAKRRSKRAPLRGDRALRRSKLLKHCAPRRRLPPDRVHPRY
jgi:ribonuclease HI